MSSGQEDSGPVFCVFFFLLQSEKRKQEGLISLPPEVCTSVTGQQFQGKRENK